MANVLEGIFRVTANPIRHGSAGGEASIIASRFGGNQGGAAQGFAAVWFSSEETSTHKLAARADEPAEAMSKVTALRQAESGSGVDCTHGLACARHPVEGRCCRGSSGNWHAGYTRRVEAYPLQGRTGPEPFSGLRALIATTPRRFSLNAAICDGSARRSRFAVALQKEFALIAVVPIWPYTERLFEQVHQERGAEPYDALFISGLDEALQRSDMDHDALYSDLQASLPRWKAWFPCPVVFWIDTFTATLLQTRVPAFWEWQSGIFRLD